MLQTKEQTNLNTNFASILILFLSALYLLLFQINYYPPIFISILIMSFVVLFFYRKFTTKKIGILVFLYLIVFLLPFIHIPPYLWFDFDNEDPLFLWGLAVNPYMVNESIIKLTAMIGAICALGFALPVAKKSNKIVEANITTYKTLKLEMWILWLMVGLLLSWLNAPEKSILQSNYGESTSKLENSNFASAWMVSYIILSFCVSDALLELNKRIKKIKINLVTIVLLIILIYLQLLRGDRESLPFILGVILAFKYWTNSKTDNKLKKKFPFKMAIFFGFIFLFIAMGIGVLRSHLSSVENLNDILTVLIDLNEIGVFSLTNILHGTWSAVLLTPLSVAGDHVNNLLKLNLGKDYLNLFLSIPPGFVANLIGYTRPIDGSAGPAWEMRYGLGGTHASVVPFMNFRLLGVFIFSSLYSYIINKSEIFVKKNFNQVNLSLLITLVMVSPHWLWYGEKNIMNAFFIWYLFSLIYKLYIKIF